MSSHVLSPISELTIYLLFRINGLKHKDKQLLSVTSCEISRLSFSDL